MSYSSKPAKKKWYVVWKGRTTGVFTTWEECSAQVNGFTGAQYKAFESRAEAEAAFKGQYASYKGTSAAPPAKRPLAAATADPIPDSYCVDAACSGNPGILEYRGVYLPTKEEVFHRGPFPNGTNNIGEFLVIVQALVLLNEKGLPQPIYTDSKNGMLWVKIKKCKTTLRPNARNAALFELIAWAEEWLKTNAYHTKILHWNTAAWGEIPADFGRK